MDYIPKTTPYEHQKNARLKARLKSGGFLPAFAYFMEMGTGKTKVQIDEICEMYLCGAITLAVVFAPKGVYLNWPNREFSTHMPDDIAAQTDIISWNDGSGKSYEKRLEKLLVRDGRLKIFVINTESMSSSKKAYVFLLKLMRAHQLTLVAVDESTFIKNFDSNRTEKIISIGRMATYRRIMTGSPVTRSPLDLYSQFDFLGEKLLGFGSYYAFRNRYAVLREMRSGARKFKVVVNYQNTDDLNAKIEPYSFRVLKDDCLDLPPKIYVQREVEPTEEQLRVYTDILKKASAALGEEIVCPHCKGDCTIEYEGEDCPCAGCSGTGRVRQGEFVTATEVITQILRMHQVLCGHVKDENGVEHDLASNRIQALLDVVQETSGKVIIWSRYRRDIAKIVDALEKAYGPSAVVQYHGGVPPGAARETASTRFQTDPTCLFMVSNAQTGGYGNTWTAANLVVYYSNDYDLEKRLQSEDRAHRSGQTRSVTYVDLYCPGTVEEKIVQALRKKIDISTAIMGDGYREWLV